MNRKAFTLIELLVVIAIIAILAAILFPVFAQAKAAAKRTADMSNVKNITLGMTMYTTDESDTLAPVMQGDWTWQRYQLVLWKDSILPYIKNGGKYAKPGQEPYTRAEQGDGGVFLSPTYDHGWARTPEGFTGDSSTRFPRSYALNVDAGKNEGLGPNDGSEKNTIFPWVDYWPWETPTNKGGSGSMTSLENPAGTAMITGTRTPYPNIQANYLAYRCTDAYWCGDADPNVSYMRGVGAGLLNLGFFDGHTKAVKAKQALANDNFGLYKKVTQDGWPGRAAVLGYMRDIPEWN